MNSPVLLALAKARGTLVDEATPAHSYRSVFVGRKRRPCEELKNVPLIRRRKEAHTRHLLFLVLQRCCFKLFDNMPSSRVFYTKQARSPAQTHRLVNCKQQEKQLAIFGYVDIASLFRLLKGIHGGVLNFFFLHFAEDLGFGVPFL